MAWQLVRACLWQYVLHAGMRLACWSALTKPCLQKKCPADVRLADADNDSGVQALLSRGVYEQHTHLWGIETPHSYLDSMYSPITEGQNNRLQAAAESAFQALQEHYFLYQGVYAQGSAPEGLFALVRWMREANTGTERAARVQHALASCQDSQRPFNWDWAYTLRSVIRDASFAQMHTSQGLYEQVPVQLWTHGGASAEWLENNELAAVTVPWVLNIDPVEALPLPQRVVALRNINSLVTSCSNVSNKARVALYLTSNTARYLYICRVQDSQKANRVVRCEINGKHELSQSIMEALAEMSDVKLRFLYGLDTQLLSKGLSSDCPLPQAAITSNLQKPYVMGTDFRGPEAVFQAPACSQVIRELYDLLVSLSEQFSRTCVLRTHVGESNMFNNVHDPRLEQIGRQNLSIIIGILVQMHADDVFKQSKVLMRLGHVTAITTGQAYQLRQLPHKVCMLELNSRSNLQTFASPDLGHLPILKVLIADALYRFDYRQNKTTSYTFLDLTCNTDGAGIMHSSMEEEYYLASNVLTHYKDNTVMEDGSMAHVPVFPEDLQYLRGRLEPGSEQLVQGRGLLCSDLRLEVRNLLRFKNFIGGAQPFPPRSPRKKQRLL